MPGTESRVLPPFFWSPDSQFIVYDSGGALKKVAIAGGPPEKICDVDTFAIGGSWNRDNVIIFGSFFGPLMRVSGGAALPLTQLDASRQEISYAYPVFLPDGRHFIFSGVGFAKKYVHIGSLDSKPEEQNSRQLLESLCQYTYIPPQDSIPGFLLFLRGRALMAQQFNDRELELVGEPAQIVEQVGIFSTYYAFYSASANGILVYRTGGSQLSQATWFDRDGKPKGTAGEPSIFYGLSISSPENFGRHAGFERRRDGRALAR